MGKIFQVFIGCDHVRERSKLLNRKITIPIRHYIFRLNAKEYFLPLEKPPMPYTVSP